MRLKVESDAPDVMKRLAAAIYEARSRRRLTVRQMADQIEISESALRRIENLTSHNTRGETLFAILLWAARRGYREFAGFSTFLAKTQSRQKDAIPKPIEGAFNAH